MFTHQFRNQKRKSVFYRICVIWNLAKGYIVFAVLLHEIGENYFCRLHPQSLNPDVSGTPVQIRVEDSC